MIHDDTSAEIRGLNLSFNVFNCMFCERFIVNALDVVL